AVWHSTLQLSISQGQLNKNVEEEQDTFAVVNPNRELISVGARKHGKRGRKRKVHPRPDQEHFDVIKGGTPPSLRVISARLVYADNSRTVEDITDSTLQIEFEDASHKVVNPSKAVKTFFAAAENALMNVACPKNKSTKKPISSCIRIVGESIFRYDVEKKWGKRAIGKTFKESLLEMLQVIILKFDPEPKNDGIDDVELSDDDIGFGGADNYDDDFQGPDDYMDKDSQPVL
ncbi:hypothetical protein AKO1_002022, partial [Acrasis kona]